VRKSLARALASRGHEVIEAENGEAALAKLGQHLNFDLAILDVLMPGLSGPEVVEKSRLVKGHRVKFVLMSAFSGRHQIVGQTDRLGIDLFISKPFQDIFLVVQALEDLVDHKS
jgi:CheY-like chemotaxis protein